MSIGAKAQVTANGQTIELTPWRTVQGEVQIAKVELQGPTIIDIRNITETPDTNFTLTESKYLIIGKLHLVADYPIAKPKGKIIYFGPGEHNVEGDTLFVKSGQTVYLDKDATLNARICIEGAKNVSILGLGTVKPKKGEGIMVRRSSNVTINGPLTTQIPVGESSNVRISNTKVISWYAWGDGYNVFASSDIHYNHIFARTSDDCTTIYCTRKGYKGSSRNISFKDAVLKADVAHPIMIGLHGDISLNEIIENVTYEDILILGQNEKQVDYMGCIGINDGDNILVRNISFNNLEIRDIQKGMLFNFRVCFNRKYCTAPGRGIQNISLKNISYTGPEPTLSIISGYDDERSIDGIHFENLIINGVKISDDMPGKPTWYKTADLANIFIGEHCSDISFR